MPRHNSQSEGGFRDSGMPNNRLRSRSRGTSQSRGASPGRPPLPLRKKVEWPPCFHEDGTVFVFDPRSAMFYESESDFFYDPKSKLYYGNKKGAYFRYDETVDPPFVEVQRMAPPADAQEDTNDASLSATAVTLVTSNVKNKNTTNSKPAIAIKIKTKKVAKKKSDVPKSELVPRIRKEQAAIIEKWTEKQAELKKQLMEDKPPSPTTTTTAANNTQGVVTTSKGEPICVICKRKFATLEKLQLHEKVSDLHKQNLQNIELANQAAKRKEAPVVGGEYQDRAQKRRNLHGPDDGASTTSMTQDRTSIATQRIAPVDTLGKDNIGNQLLQKLGWDAEAAKNNRGTAAAESMRKDWENIEAKAQVGRAPR
jgi:RNA-binding protein 5/10